MPSSSLPLRPKLTHAFVFFTTIWSTIVFPVHANLLNSHQLPTLGINENLFEQPNNNEQLIAEHSKTAADFITQKNNGKDLAALTQDYALNRLVNTTSKEVENWLSQAGNARVRIDMNKKLSIKGSEFDWLIPWYNSTDLLFFTQHSIHQTDNRLQTNNGVGIRHFGKSSMIGFNTFFDHDISNYHSRLGIGAEYWKDNIKLSANNYFGISSWRSSPEFNHDYNARPAKGWDVKAEGWLGSYPALGGNIQFEQYFGHSVALFAKNKQQTNPIAATIGVNWTPIPLLSFNVDHKLGNNDLQETNVKAQINLTFNKSLAEHLDATKVASMRNLTGRYYDFVERNNNIILEYQKKTLISLSLPKKILGKAGQEISLVNSVTSQYPLKEIVWYAPELLVAGGIIRSQKQNATVILPSYKTASSQQEQANTNRYYLTAIAYDNKGNPSSKEQTIIEVTRSDTVIIKPNDIQQHGQGFANGTDVNMVKIIARDANNNIVPNAKVTFFLPVGFNLVKNKSSAISPSFSKEKQPIKKKMQAMKLTQPYEYHTTTNTQGEAQVLFTADVTGTHDIIAVVDHGEPIKIPVSLSASIIDRQINSLMLIKNNAIADGKSANRVKVQVTDNYRNPIAGAIVNFSATNANIIATGITNDKGFIEVPLTSTTVGISQVSAEINNSTQTIEVNFVSGDLANVLITSLSPVMEGESAVIHLKLTDEKNNPITGISGMKKAIIGGIATDISITEVTTGNGEYTASLPAQKIGEHTIQVIINGISSAVSTLKVTAANPVIAAQPDGSGTQGSTGVIETISIKTSATRNIKPGDLFTVTMIAKDASHRGITQLDINKIKLGQHQYLNWIDNNDGTYTITLPIIKTGKHDLTVSIGQHFSPPLFVTVDHLSGANNVATINITNPAHSIDAGTQSPIFISLEDKFGNLVTDVNSSELKTIIDNQETVKIKLTENPQIKGEYILTLPPLNAGRSTIVITTANVSSTPLTIKIAPQVLNVSQTNGEGISGGLGAVADIELIDLTRPPVVSGSLMTFLVTFKDSFGNSLIGINIDNILTHNQKEIKYISNKDGSYTLVVNVGEPGVRPFIFNANGIKKFLDINVIKSNNTLQFSNIEILTVGNNQPIAAGTQSSISVKLTNANKAPILGVKKITAILDGQKYNLVITELPNKPGEYTSSLPALKSGYYDLIVSAGNARSQVRQINIAPTIISVSQGDNVGITPQIGNMTIKPSTKNDLYSGDTLQIIINVEDIFGNHLAGLTENQIHLDTMKIVKLQDNHDGTYTANLLLTTVGYQKIIGSISGISSNPISITVKKLSGPKHVAKIDFPPSSVPAYSGLPVSFIISLKDKSGNPVIYVRDSDIKIKVDGIKESIIRISENPQLNGKYLITIPVQKAGERIIEASINNSTAAILEQTQKFFIPSSNP
ncbi:inverse autotransporter beta domain-containing protein [Providencia sp. Me31A]|uniref:inverse autotransporter beta domain-containing protein n=1 Tax=Providencia sp. Me31A TaxID=3392637 RepID=UPI003D27E37B